MTVDTQRTPFLTSFIHSAAQGEKIRNLSNPHGWRLASLLDPSRRFYVSETGRCVLEQPDEETIQRLLRHGNSPMQALVIEAPLQPEDTEGPYTSRDDVENIAVLIHIGVLLGWPDLYSQPSPTTFNLRRLSADVVGSSFRRCFTHAGEKLVLGCQVAITAWGDTDLIYALHKYRFSLETDHFSPHSAHPRYGQLFGQPLGEYDYHVRAAMAITAAYSAIEELGLQISNPRSGGNRFVGNQLRSDLVEQLDQKLRAANMHAGQKVYWMQRGSDPHPLERSREEQPGAPSPYSGWRDVRDIEITLPEAIHLVSWLRNKHSTHKFSAYTPTLTPHDVHNCQMVARRLLLGRMNLWSEGE